MCAKSYSNLTDVDNATGYYDKRYVLHVFSLFHYLPSMYQF